jgi:pimeloyl-ACP methyl ester carboxylesterase
MIRPGCRRALVLCLVVLASCSGGGERQEHDAAEEAPITIGVCKRIESAALGRAVEIQVAVPDAVASEGLACPVVYLLDGEAKFRHASASVEVLSGAHMMPASIVVGIETHNRSRDFQPADRAGLLLEFIEDELVPLIEASYPTLPHRTLIGHSLGGLFVLHAMAARPGLFDAHIALSATLQSEFAPGPRSRAVPVLGRLEDRLHDLIDGQPYLYLAAGEVEREDVLSDLEQCQALLREAAPPNLRWRAELLAGENHQSCVVEGVFEGLKGLYQGWSDAEVVADGDLADLRAHYEALSQRFGYPVPLTEERLLQAGFSLLGRDRKEEAIEVFREAIDAHPRSARAEDSLAYALEATGATERALEVCRSALAKAEECRDQEQAEAIAGHIEHLEDLLRRVEPEG